MTLYVAFVWTCPHQERRNTWLLWGKAAQSLYYTIRFTRCTAALHVVSRTTESGTRARVGVNSSGVGGARDHPGCFGRGRGSCGAAGGKRGTRLAAEQEFRAEMDDIDREYGI